MYPHIVTDTSLSVFMNNKSLTIASDHMHFEEVRTAIREGRWEDIEGLVDTASTVRDWMAETGEPGFKLEAGIIVLDDEPFSGDVSDKVLRMVDAGTAPDPLLRCLRKIRENPSATAQRESLLFAVANDFMIHESGDFIAFKGVKSDYFDQHSGTVRYMVGDVPTMPRHKVDDRRNVTCSFGLHFGSKEQADMYGSRTMVVRVNPADIVSIPEDYDNQKGRCCRMTVIAELEQRIELPRQEVYADRDLGIEDEEDFECSECGSIFCDEGYCENQYDDEDDDEYEDEGYNHPI
jgi:hypothetical protein